MGEKNQLVSIIIPAYNAARYVKGAVDSALAQTYPNVEVIVVDDGSTDNTAEILSPYAAAGKIKYVKQENKGLAGARNAGIRVSRGAYVALLDSDDLFLPEKISRQAAALESHPDFGVCYCDLIHFADSQKGRRFYHHRYKYPSGDIFPDLLQAQLVNPLAVMLRRSVLDAHGLFDESLRRSEDWEMWLRLSRAGVKFYYLGEPLAQYRIGQGGANLSSLKSEPEMKEKNLEIFEKLGGTLSPLEWERYGFAHILKKLRWKVVAAYLMAGRKREAVLKARAVCYFAPLLVRLLPAGFWSLGLGSARRLKHRLLLRREPAA